MKPDQTSKQIANPEAAARAYFSVLAVIAAALASSVLITLGGCASYAGIAPVAQQVTPKSVGLEGVTVTSPIIPADWWHSFGDTALNELVDRALIGSPSLKVAQARVARSEAAIASTKAADGLQINGSLDATRQLFSENSIYPPPLGGSVRTLATAQMSASYEFDFFGRNRAAIEAAVGAHRAAQADLQAARIVLASNVARTYVQLGRLFEQREVLARTLKQRDEILALIKQRVQSGLDTNVELRQGEGALPESRQQIEQLDEQIMLTRHALAALTAQSPNALDSLIAPLRTVQAIALPAALPADLLGRRADVSAARWRIEAATRDIARAKAQFYPNINLTAFAGLASIGLNRLIGTGSEQWGVGPALRLPIFDSGRLRANLLGKTADLDAAIESYNGTVLDAVHDAADQISSLRSIALQQAQQAGAQAAAESAYDLAGQRFKAGLSNYLTVLNAESNLLNQRRQAVDLKARALDVQIALIRAVGGGYNAESVAANINNAPAIATKSTTATPISR